MGTWRPVIPVEVVPAESGGDRLTPGPKPRDLDAYLRAAPAVVREVIERQGPPLSWR